MTRRAARRRRGALPLSLPVVAALALSLGACGDDGGASEPPTPPDGAGETTAPGPAAPDPDVDAARAGLAGYLEANRPPTPQTSTNIEGCPALDLASAQAALAEVGHGDVTLGGWGTEIEWDEYEAFGPDVLGIACGGDSDGNPNDGEVGVGLAIAAVDLAPVADDPRFEGFDSFVEATGLDGVSAVDAPEGAPPGEWSATCFPGEGCLAFWYDDGLVLAVGLLGESATQEQAQQLLQTTLPELLTTLASG